MLRNGIPEEVAFALQSVSRSFRGWGATGQGDAAARRRRADLPFRDRTLEALHRPGHSPSDTVFWDARAPDPDRRRPPDRPHLLQPADHPPAGRLRQADPGARHLHRVDAEDAGDAGRDRPLRPRRADLDHVALIDDRLAKHERRKEKIYELIAEQPRSGYEIAQAIWGNVAVTQAFLTLSEVIGHADLLVNEGRVREVDDGEVIRYETAG